MVYCRDLLPSTDKSTGLRDHADSPLSFLVGVTAGTGNPLACHRIDDHKQL
jgi:hypothetical protein